MLPNLSDEKLAWKEEETALMLDLDSTVKRALNITVRGRGVVVIVVYLYVSSVPYVFVMSWISFQPHMNFTGDQNNR